MWNYIFWEDSAAITYGGAVGLSEADKALFSPEDFISDDEAG